MKKYPFHFVFVGFAALLFSIGIITCSEKDEAVSSPVEQTVETESTASSSGLRTTSGGTGCSVSCKGGSCSASGASAMCRCNFWGKPVCTSGGGLSSGITADPSVSNYYDGLIALVSGFSSPAGDAAAGHLSGVLDLLVLNAFEITAAHDIQMYHNHANALEALEPGLTPSERTQIADYVELYE